MYQSILSKEYGNNNDGWTALLQWCTERYYLEIKCCLGSEDTVKEVIYKDNDLEMVKDFAKRYRLYQVAKSLTGG